MSLRTFRIAITATCLLVSLPLAAAPQGSVELLNQLTVLRNEVQALRAEIEQLQRQQQLQADNARSQYLDLDSRLARLEGGAPVPGAAALEVPADSGPAVSPPPETVAEAPAPDGDIPVASGNEEQDYLAAFDALKQGDYVASARAFQEFLARHPDGFFGRAGVVHLGDRPATEDRFLSAEGFTRFDTTLGYRH